jgi:hypothetical protein
VLVRARQLGLVFAWVLIAAIVVFETLGMRDYLAMIDDSGTLPTDSLPFRHVVPADYADAYTWTRYAVAVDSSGDWRIRRTDIDNAPVGREVHWNSAFVHLVAAAGRLRSAATGEPLSAATERARVWFNLPLFMSVVVLFSWIAASRFGTAAGIVLAFGMLGHRWFYDGFAPGYVDHHGLLTAATFGVVFGATLMGAGWRGIEGDSILPRSRRDARIGAAISAASGAVGPWISAASVIPTIAFVGLGAWVRASGCRTPPGTAERSSMAPCGAFGASSDARARCWRIF